MLLSGHQPVYLPGIILFNKIALSDAFMFVGHCQYSPKSWQTRNRVRGHEVFQLLSIPVLKDMGQSINETQFAGYHWRRKHLRTIEMMYRKRPFFKEYFPEFVKFYEMPLPLELKYLGAMNEYLIKMMLELFQIETPLVPNTNVTGHKTDMLISMCKAVGADEYLSNEGARAYVDEQKMLDAGIKHRWQKFIHPIYDQGHKEFIPNLSAIDLLFNCGPESGKIIRECGHVG